MADEKKKDTKPAKPEGKDKNPKESGSDRKSYWFLWAMLGAIIVGGTTGGFALSQLLGGTDPVCPAAEAKGPDAEKENFDDFLSKNAAAQVSWLYDKMDPIVANLDEPGVTRYVRAGVTLEMSPEMDRTKGESYLEERKMILRDWLTTYFAGLSLEDVRGTRNLEKIKRQIQDQFNEILFANGKPYVQRILFREFAVQ
jgi:flagellar basal body-associated protein FliL